MTVTVIVSSGQTHVSSGQTETGDIVLAAAVSQRATGVI